eukprot:COSAG02_NODE_29239_length_573_cov_1.069620_1_plen_79_part_00
MKSEPGNIEESSIKSLAAAAIEATQKKKLAVGGGPLDELQRLTVCSADPGLWRLLLTREQSVVTLNSISVTTLAHATE